METPDQSSAQENQTCGSCPDVTEEVVPESQRLTDPRFAGRWRIVEMEVWGQDYVDIEVPGHVTFDDEQMGEFQFGAVRGWLDCRFEEREGVPRVEFSWEGANDADDACGRGWATVEGDRLRGRLFIHRGDDSAFEAVRQPAGPGPVPARRPPRRRRRR